MFEHTFHREPAIRWIEFQAVKGHLILTRDKLSFLCEDPDNGADWSVTLRHLDKVDYFKKLELFRGNLLVIGKDGEVNRFGVEDHRSWKERILRSARAV